MLRRVEPPTPVSPQCLKKALTKAQRSMNDFFKPAGAAGGALMPSSTSFPSLPAPSATTGTTGGKKGSTLKTPQGPGISKFFSAPASGGTGGVGKKTQTQAQGAKAGGKVQAHYVIPKEVDEDEEIVCVDSEEEDKVGGKRATKSPSVMQPQAKKAKK